MFHLKVFLILALSILICRELQAQSTLTMNAPTQQKKTSGVAVLGYSSNLQEPSAYDHQAELSALMVLNYKLNPTHSLRAIVSGSQEQTQGKESKLNDSVLGWNSPRFWHQSDDLSIGQQVQLSLPSSKDSRVRDQKIVGISVIPVFQISLAPIGVTNTLLIYRPSLTKNFHTYQQNRIHKNNVEYSHSQMLSLNISLSDKFYIEPAFSYGQGWSYGGVKRDDKFSFNSEVGYQATEQFALSLGVSNDGYVRKFENGSNQNIEFFNNKTATYYSSVSYIF